ncbi:MAG: hypothetical protein J6U54_20210 [Clostridiales bacterium]|nr:hypothetical protein [Clostridiales bacterium]
MRKLCVLCLIFFFVGCAANKNVVESAITVPVTTPTCTEGVSFISKGGSTVTPTDTVSVTPTATVTLSPLPTPTDIPTPSPTNTPKPTKTPTPKPTKTPTPKPSDSTKIVPYPTGKVGTQYTDDKNGHTWKPLARYQAITNKNSIEYKLMKQEKTDSNGLRYLVDPNGVKRYCIALEPQWAGGQSVDIGRCIDIQMTNGAVLHCVLCDCKRHEKSWNKEGRYGSKGELIEFIVDLDKVSKQVRAHGDASYVSKEFEGGVISITVLDLYIAGYGH